MMSIGSLSDQIMEYTLNLVAERSVVRESLKGMY